MHKNVRNLTHTVAEYEVLQSRPMHEVYGSSRKTIKLGHKSQQKRES